MAKLILKVAQEIICHPYIYIYIGTSHPSSARQYLTVFMNENIKIENSNT